MRLRPVRGAGGQRAVSEVTGAPPSERESSAAAGREGALRQVLGVGPQHAGRRWGSASIR